MPQISIYANAQDYSQIEQSAKKAGKSISSFVMGLVMPQIKPAYSDEFKSLFGSVNDETFRRPERSDFAEEARRETL
jgi:hypothetical protein